MAPCEGGRRRAVAGQEVEESLDARRVVAELRRELPQERAELAAQLEEPRSEEVRERRLHVLELAHVRDVAAALYREHEIVRHLVAPARVARRRLQGIEAAVQLDAVEALRGVAELQALRQALRVELPAPARVPPARDADANRHAATIRGSERGSRAVGASGGRATRGGAGGASAVIRRARHERHPDLVL